MLPNRRQACSFRPPRGDQWARPGQAVEAGRSDGRGSNSAGAHIPL